MFGWGHLTPKGGPHPYRPRDPTGPTFGECGLAKFWTVSEIFEVKLFPFDPHNVTTDKLSAPLKCHVVELVGGYNVLMLCDHSVDTARVIRDLSFRFSPYWKKCTFRIRAYTARAQQEKSIEDAVERELPPQFQDGGRPPFWKSIIATSQWTRT